MGKPALISKAVAYLRNPRQRKPVLPAFWDCEWSSEYDRWYYVNEKTNVTTWEVPTKPAEGPAEKAKLAAGAAADRGTHSPLPVLLCALDNLERARAETVVALGVCAETGPVSINHVTEGRLAHVLSTNMADAIVKARDQGPFASLADCSARRTPRTLTHTTAVDSAKSPLSIDAKQQRLTMALFVRPASRVRALGKAKQRDLQANQILFPPDDKDCPGVAAASNGGVKREREDGDDESGAKRAKS